MLITYLFHDDLLILMGGLVHADRKHAALGTGGNGMVQSGGILHSRHAHGRS